MVVLKLFYNLEMQLKGCAEICSIFGLPSYASKVYEADDIIGTLANSVRQANSSTQVIIISKDKDLVQLIESEQDYVWDYNGNRRRHLNDIIEEFGVTPQQFPDYLGLIGDSVDCISGVPGVGPVKAKALLQQFQDIDDIYANLDIVSSLEIRGANGLAKTLEGNRPLANLSKQLATIVCEIQDKEEAFGSASLKNLELGSPDELKFLEFLTHYKFRDSDRNRLTSLFNNLNSE